MLLLRVFCGLLHRYQGRKGDASLPTFSSNILNLLLAYSTPTLRETPPTGCCRPGSRGERVAGDMPTTSASQMSTFRGGTPKAQQGFVWLRGVGQQAELRVDRCLTLESKKDVASWGPDVFGPRHKTHCAFLWHVFVGPRRSHVRHVSLPID